MGPKLQTTPIFGAIRSQFVRSNIIASNAALRLNSIRLLAAMTELLREFNRQLPAKLDGVDYAAIGEQTGVHPMDVRRIIDGLMGLAATELKKTGKFKIANMLNLKLVVQPATASHIKRMTNREYVIKAKPKAYVIKAKPTKFMEALVSSE